MNWKVNSKSTHVGAEYKDDALRIDVSYNLDPETGTVTSLNGTAYAAQDGTYLGTFNRTGESYAFNGIRRADMPAMLDAIDAIEQHAAEEA